MINKICFMFVTPALINDDKKYLMNKIMERKYTVEVCDVTPVIEPSTENSVTQKRFCSDNITYFRMTHKSEIQTYIANNKNTTFFFPMFDVYYNVKWIYWLYKKYNIYYGYVNNLVSCFDVNVRAPKKEMRKRLLSPYHIKEALYNRLLRKLIKYKCAEFIAFGSYECEKAFFDLGMCDKHTKKLYLHTFDYERFLDVPTYDSAREYCVFLDQYLPFHPDIKIQMNLDVDPGKYYKELNDIFDKIQQLYNLEIIIAAHPRADYSDKQYYIGKYKVVYGKTAALVKGARVVLAHYSTSIGWGILAKKPIVILNTPTLQEHKWFDMLCREYANKLNCLLLVSQKDVSNRIFEYDELAYTEFVKRYLSCESNVENSLWDSVLKEISKI